MLSGSRCRASSGSEHPSVDPNQTRPWYDSTAIWLECHIRVWRRFGPQAAKRLRGDAPRARLRFEVSSGRRVTCPLPALAAQPARDSRPARRRPFPDAGRSSWQRHLLSGHAGNSFDPWHSPRRFGHARVRPARRSEPDLPRRKSAPPNILEHPPTRPAPYPDRHRRSRHHHLHRRY